MKILLEYVANMNLFLIVIWIAVISLGEGESNSSSLTVPQSSHQQSSLKEEIVATDACLVEKLSACNEASCPPGLFCNNGQCECGISYPKDILTCNGTDSSLSNTYCATYDETSDLVTVGACSYGKQHSTMRSSYDIYLPLPRNALNLTDFICGSFGRTGVLCGKCLPNHYPLAYSYDMTCVHCLHKHLNWLKYFAAAYLPLTLFYFVLLFFNIKLVSARLYGIVYCCQTLALPVALRLMLGILSRRTNFPFIILAKLVASLYGIWNLDFFRPFYSELCLGLGVLPTLALDYVIAVYPLFLMLITYIFITLYDKNYRIVTAIWRPFRGLFHMFKKNWNIRTSMIDVFASFFFLSNVKFLSVSFDLLIPTTVYHLHRNFSESTLGLFYAGDIEYFGSEHLPYAVLAVVMLLVFFILPVSLLALYPFAFFQKFLNLFPVCWHVLHTFMDSFLGCYKNGTEPGTCDCRWFASVFLIFRFCMYVTYSATVVNLFVILMMLLLLLLIVLMTLVQPFRSSTTNYNAITSSLLHFPALIFVIISGETLINSTLHYNGSIMYILGAIFGTVPLLYATTMVTHWVFAQRRFGHSLLLKVRARSKGYNQLQEESLSDWVSSAHNRLS